MQLIRCFLCLFCVLQSSASLHAAPDFQVAVAANFQTTAKALLSAFESTSGYEGGLSSASSGKLTAQILHGAPFDIFLSADQSKPAYLVEKGIGEASSVFTYAVGQLVLWRRAVEGEKASIAASDSAALKQVLVDHGNERFALANPKLAPYGLAAEETLKALGEYSRMRAQLVLAENVSQTYQFAETGNVVYGFIALSQVYLDGKVISGVGLVVPQKLYPPIRQDAVLIRRHGKLNEAAAAFLTFLKTDQAETVMKEHGYQVER